MSVLEDIATRLQVQLEGLKTGTSQTYNDVLDDLSRVLAAETAGRELSDMSRRQVETLIRRVRSAHESNLDRALAILIDTLRDLSGYTFETETTALMVASTAGVRQDTGIRALWDRVLERPMGHDGSLLEPFLERLNTSQIVATENMIRRAHTEGWSNSQMMQAFRGTRRNRFTDGIQNTLGRAARAVVHTAIQHVNSASRAVVWDENSDIVQGYRWVSTLDSRTSPECRALDGQTFELGKGPLPPAHMSCRSTTVAVLDPVFDQVRDLLTRASASGPVPQRMTYYEWLKQQDADFQDSVLGVTRGLLFRNGGLTAEEFARLQLNRFFDPLTLEEMRRLKPLAFARAGI